MKKLSLLSLFLLLSLSAFSQVKIGLRVAPAMVMNRIGDADKDDGLAYGNYKSSFGFTFGPQFDFHFSDNAAFTTGLWFTALGSSYEVNLLGLSPEYVKSSTQYVVLPVGFKAYTNEVMTNGKIYFNCMGTVDVKVSEKYAKSSDEDFEDDYQNYQSMFGAGIQIGAGLELGIGESNAVSAGLFFNHDLFNRAGGKEMYDGSDTDAKDLLTQKRSQIGLEVGFKF